MRIPFTAPGRARTGPLGTIATPRPTSAKFAWFDATIRPNRSLKRRGFAVLASALFLSCSPLALFALRAGLWIPAALLLATVGSTLAAVAWKARRLDRVQERIVLTDTSLTVHPPESRGVPARAVILDPTWLRLEREMHPFAGCERIILTSRGRRIVVAELLSPEERSEFADALDTALMRRSANLWRRNDNLNSGNYK